MKQEGIRGRSGLLRAVRRTGTLGVLAALAACSAAANSEGVGTSHEAVTGSCATTPIIDQSLFVSLLNTEGATNPFGVAALKNFSFQSVMDQIVTSGAKGSNQTALELYQQLIDTLNKAPGDTKGPHCTGKINGFDVDCPRPEGILAKTNPFTGTGGLDILSPVALVNRFDLAPSNGANCGEYRIVFAINPSKLSFPVARFLMIFEATLPNPEPTKGLAACLPVAQFWDKLSTKGITESSFAEQLKSFYFDGIAAADGAPKFAPVISAANYGIGAPSNTNTGQIRVNMLSTAQWQLREFRLSQECTTAGVCTLTANNTPVQNNPFGALFAEGATGTGKTFQSEFISQVKSLAADSVPLISMTTPNVDNAGQSSEQDETNDYAFQAGLLSGGGGGSDGGIIQGDASGPPPPPLGLTSGSSSSENTALSKAIQAELTKLGSKLTPLDIVQRATTQSCAGCHELSPGTDLGGGLTWPFSNGFTQVDEFGNQSPALTQSFLPFRQKVLENFIDDNCSGKSTASSDPTTTVSGTLVGAAN